jgi:NACalpha-BTF3-like transcription factor
MSYYGYSARNYMPDRGGTARALQGAGSALTQVGDLAVKSAGMIQGVQDRKAEQAEKAKLLENLKVDAAKADEIYRTNFDQETKRLAELGVEDPEVVVAQYYLPKFATETPTDAVKRWADADTKYKQFYDMKKGEHSLNQAKSAVADAVNRNQFSPETIQAIAQQFNVPIEKLQSEMDSANKDRAQSQAEAIPQGATQEDAFRTLASSGQRPAPATADLVGSLPKTPPKAEDPLDVYKKLLDIKKLEKEVQDKVRGLDAGVRGKADANLKYLNTQIKEAENRIRVLTKDWVSASPSKDAALDPVTMASSDYGRQIANQIGKEEIEIQQLQKMAEYLRDNPASPLSIPELQGSQGQLPWQSKAGAGPQVGANPTNAPAAPPSSSGSIPVMGAGGGTSGGAAQIPPEVLAMAQQAVNDPEATPDEWAIAQEILSAAGAN